jgi:hypothetical protein
MKKVFIAILFFLNLVQSDAQEQKRFWKLSTGVRRLEGEGTNGFNRSDYPVSPSQLRANFLGDGSSIGYSASLSYNGTLNYKGANFYFGGGLSFFAVDVPFESPIKTGSYPVGYKREGILKMRRFSFDLPIVFELRKSKFFLNGGFVLSLGADNDITAHVTKTQYVEDNKLLTQPIVTYQDELWTLNSYLHKFLFAIGRNMNQQVDVFVETSLFLNNINRPGTKRYFLDYVYKSAALNALYQSSLEVGVRYKLKKK